MENEDTMYCAENPEITFKGCLESQTLKYDHSYIIYDVKRCINEASKDVECASNDEIDEWLQHKNILLRVI